MLPDAAGDVEQLIGITPGNTLELVGNLFDHHLDYLELSFVPGSNTAMVRTKIPLDADNLTDVSQAHPSVPTPGLTL